MLWIFQRRYVESVITREWPVERSGGSSEDTWEVVDTLARSIIAYQPTTEHARLVYPEVLRGINQLLDQRRIRLFLGADGIGLITWVVVLLGALVTIGMACFFNTPSAPGHYSLVGTMSAMFGLMIYMIIALDHPLIGPNGVGSGPFVEVRENIDHWEAQEPPPAPVTARAP